MPPSARPSHLRTMANLHRVWQGLLTIGQPGQPALTRLCEDGTYRPWLDWTNRCPFDYNALFPAPPPAAPNAGATAQLLDGFPQTLRCPTMQVLNDYGELVERSVRHRLSATAGPPRARAPSRYLLRFSAPSGGAVRLRAAERPHAGAGVGVRGQARPP